MTSYTLFGLIAIIFWATNVGFTRILTEQLGGFLCCGIEMLASGLLLTAYRAIKEKSITSMLRLPKKYLWGCGALFTAYSVMFYLSMYLCRTSFQAIVASTLNYLWPTLTIVFGIPLLYKRYKPLPFCLGIVITLVGTFGVSLGDPSGFSFDEISGPTLTAYLLMVIAAVSWALYSCLVTKWIGNRNDDANALPLFMIAAGILSGVIGLIQNPHPVLSAGMWLPMIYKVIFPGMLAYFFWDLGMAKGNTTVITFASLFIVVLSVIASSVILHTPIRVITILFCILIALGAVICKSSEHREQSPKLHIS